MARIGHEKVRTGCLTCKARRVKCDEGKPTCLRCRTARRACAGYQDAPTGSFSWRRLLQPQPAPRPGLSLLSPGTLTPAQSRSLEFFLCEVEPACAGPLDHRFWATLVLQSVAREAACRHAVLAVSQVFAIYSKRRAGAVVTRDEEEAATRAYNRALRLTRTARGLDISTVLVAAVLFTCVEFLRGSVEGALCHSRHAILLLTSAGARSRRTVEPEITAQLQHLSIFPFFFCAPREEVLRFPDLASGSGSDSEPAAASLPALGGALDGLLSRSARLVRCVDNYRLDAAGACALPEDALDRQTHLLRALAAWRSRFEAFRGAAGRCESQRDAEACRQLEMRWLVAHIWTSATLRRDEMAYDAYHEGMQRIVALARESLLLGVGGGGSGSSSPQDRRAAAAAAAPTIFRFGMGVATLLHFVVVKCRHLRTRLDAFHLIRAMGLPRESLWDAETMDRIGIGIIEREHGIDMAAPPRVVGPGWPVPGDSVRVRASQLLGADRDGGDARDGLVIKQEARVGRSRLYLFVKDPETGQIVLEVSRSFRGE